jgi:hypothetical protein
MDDPRNYTKPHETQISRNSVRVVSCDWVRVISWIGFYSENKEVRHVAQRGLTPQPKTISLIELKAIRCPKVPSSTPVHSVGVTCPMKGGCQEKTSPMPAALDISGSQPLNVRDGLAV